ncbi:MAG: molybdopterin-guanine dinucleotide biosynthesis protein B [Pseudomonadota bacterium]
MICGLSGSGKTELVCRLLTHFRAQKLKLATIKHAHAHFDLDQAGKDSWRHRHAGASEVLIASMNRWALIHEQKPAMPPHLPTLLAKLAPVDLVLIEGFKRTICPKIEVRRPGYQGPELWRSDPAILACASEQPIPDGPCFLKLDDLRAIADFILSHAIPAEQIG